jgi:hypothetical protein
LQVEREQWGKNTAQAAERQILAGQQEKASLNLKVSPAPIPKATTTYPSIQLDFQGFTTSAKYFARRWCQW